MLIKMLEQKRYQIKESKLTLRDRLLEISFSFNSYLKPKIDNGYKILVKLIKKAFKSPSFV